MGAPDRAGKGWSEVACLTRTTTLILLLLAGHWLIAQPAEALVKPPLPGLVLKAGEGLAMTLGDDQVHLYGEARMEAPMGGLAKLVWMRLEGAEWASRGYQFRCTGRLGADACTRPKGHGRVDVGGALRQDCHLAFLAWIADSRQRWLREYTEAPARLRLEEVFAPFLGRRLPPDGTLPPFSLAWVGEGDLLRTSPEAFLRWLMEPDKEEVVTFGKRYLAGFWVEIKDLFGKEGWWFKTGTAPIPGVPGSTSAWVAGGKGPVLVVLHVPQGTGEQEGLHRIREILGLKP